MKHNFDNLFAKDLFLSFLESNGILSSYRSYLSKAHSDLSLDEYCSLFGPEDYLAYSFLWTETSEGASFWRKYYSRWINVCKLFNL